MERERERERDARVRMREGGRNEGPSGREEGSAGEGNAALTPHMDWQWSGNVSELIKRKTTVTCSIPGEAERTQVDTRTW